MNSVLVWPMDIDTPTAPLLPSVFAIPVATTSDCTSAFANSARHQSGESMVAILARARGAHRTTDDGDDGRVREDNKMDCPQRVPEHRGKETVHHKQGRAAMTAWLRPATLVTPSIPRNFHVAGAQMVRQMFLHSMATS